MTSTRDLLYPGGPLENVWLVNGYEDSSDAWGSTVQYKDIRGLTAAVFGAIISKPSRLTGAEITFLRFKLDLPQLDCALLLAIKEQTFSLWEREKYPIPVAEDVILRRVCVEKLRKALPKGFRIPSTEEFICLAVPQKAGKYLARYEQNRWQVQHVIEQHAAEVDILRWATFMASTGTDVRLPTERVHVQAGSLVAKSSVFGYRFPNPEQEAIFDEFRLGESRLATSLPTVFSATHHAGDSIQDAGLDFSNVPMVTRDRSHDVEGAVLSTAPRQVRKLTTNITTRALH